MVAFSKNTEAQTLQEAEQATYSRTNQPILHVRQNCSGMHNPRVHYLPVEVGDLVRWCGNCTGYGADLEMPDYCPCCDNRLGPGGPMKLVQYAKHVMTRLVNLQAPITRDSTCDERYQRMVLEEARRYSAVRNTLRAAGAAGNERLVGDWFGRMLRRNPYFGPHI